MRNKTLIIIIRGINDHDFDDLAESITNIVGDGQDDFDVVDDVNLTMADIAEFRAAQS